MFKRYTEILTGNKKITSDDLEIYFDIPFTRSKEQDIGEVVIFNLSESTVNDIREHKNINIMAGYKDQKNVANIFTGVVKQVVTTWQSTDKEVRLLLADGGYLWASSTLKKTYPKGSKDSVIMADLINLMGQKPALVKPKNDRVHADGYKVDGLKRTELQKLVDDSGSTMINQGGFVYINGGEPVGETGFILNAKTGLIGVPEDITEYDENGNAKTPTWRIEMLLNPLIVKGTKIKIESHNLNGEFVVQAGRHNKDFNTEAEIVRWSGG